MCPAGPELELKQLDVKIFNQIMSLNWNIYNKTHQNAPESSWVEKLAGFWLASLFLFTFFQDQVSAFVLLRKIVFILCQPSTLDLCGLCLRISCSLPDCGVFRMFLAAVQKRSYLDWDPSAPLSGRIWSLWDSPGGLLWHLLQQWCSRYSTNAFWANQVH